MVVLGVHDLRFMASQSVPVDEVFEQAQDGSFPPSNDLALIRLSEPARSGEPRRELSLAPRSHRTRPSTGLIGFARSALDMHCGFGPFRCLRQKVKCLTVEAATANQIASPERQTRPPSSADGRV